MQLEGIATFVTAAQEGSMAAAGRTLGVPTSTVSRRIHRLEADLGLQLVEVHPRLFRLTEAGDALLRRASSAVRDLLEATHALRDGSGVVRGQLRLSFSQDIGTTSSVTEMLAAFRREHPGVELLVDLNNKRVDLMAQGIDFAFRAHQGPLIAQPSLMSRRLTRLSGALYASPAYLRAHGHPQTHEDLAHHSMLQPTFGGTWSLRHPETDEPLPLIVPSPVRSTSLAFMTAGAEAGLGIAPIPDLVAKASVMRGTLVRVLPAHRLDSASLTLLWPSSRLPAPRRRAFLDFVVAHARQWGDEEVV